MFFILLQNDSSKISLYDIASRKLVDNNKIMFVSLLSNGNNVCEKRKEDGLLGIMINWDKPFTQPSKIVTAFDNILNIKKQIHVILSEKISYGTTGINHYY